MTDTTKHEMTLGGHVTDFVRSEEANYAVVALDNPSGGKPFMTGVPVPNGTYVLMGDALKVVVSWEHNEHQTREIALATGALDPVSEVDSEGNQPVPVGD